MAITSKTFAEAITFTRSSDGGYYDMNGNYKIAASNEPRIDFEPSTGEKLGLLVEESRTNFYLDTGDFSVSTWVKNGDTEAVPRFSAAPDGSLTSNKLSSDNFSTSANHVRQTAIAPNAGDHTVSVFAKDVDDGFCRVRIISSGAVQTDTNSTFDFSAEDWSTINANHTVVKTKLSNGWWRLSVTLAINTGGLNFELRLSGAKVTPSSLLLWGAQLEEGAFPTSYIASTETFTSRAGPATYYDSAGILQTAAIDVERINYNPADLTAPGKQLFEESRTNLFTYSEQFDNAAWTKTNSTINPDEVTAPDGNATADKLIPNNGLANTSVRFTPTTTAAASVSLSVFAKAGEFSDITIFVGKSGGSNFASLTFNLSTEVLTGTASDKQFIEDAGNGWYRLKLSAQLDGGVTNPLCIIRCDNTGDGASGLYIWGAQIEEGDYVTSYIQTVASQVTRSTDVYSSAQSTRAADIPVVNGFSDWYNQSQGTMFFDAYMRHEYSNVFLGVSSSSSDDAIYVSDGANKVRTNIVAGGVSSAALDSTNSFPIDQSFKFAMAFDSAGVQAILEGDTVKSDTSVTIASNMSTMKLGLAPWGSANQMNGHIKSVKYYARKLSQTELEGLVA